MSEANNPLNQGEEDVRQPTELEVLKERAKKMGIVHSNNIGVEALRQKIAEKQEGKGENFNPALPETVTESKPAAAQSTSLFSLGRTNPVAQTAQATQVAAEGAQNQETVEELKAKLEALTASRVIADAPAASEADLEKKSQDVVNPLTGSAQPVRKRTLQQMMREEQTKLVRLRIQNLDPKKKDLQGEIITVANEYLGTVKKFVPYGEVTDNGYHVPYCIYEFLKTKRFLNIRTTRDRVTKQIKVEHNMALEYSLEVLDPLTKEELARLAASQAAAGSLN